MTRLTGPDLYAWMALRRVHRGGVTKTGNLYLDRDRRIPCFLPDVLDELTAAELLTLTEADPAGQQRVSATTAGQARYAALSRQEGVTP